MNISELINTILFYFKMCLVFIVVSREINFTQFPAPEVFKFQYRRSLASFEAKIPPTVLTEYFNMFIAGNSEVIMMGFLFH